MEHTPHAHAPEPLHAAGAGFLRSPLGIAALMIVSSTFGGWIKDRLDTETRDSASEVRIQSSEHRIEQLEANEVSAAQFREYEKATDTRLDDIRDLVKEINHNLSMYGPPPASHH